MYSAYYKGSWHQAVIFSNSPVLAEPTPSPTPRAIADWLGVAQALGSGKKTDRCPLANAGRHGKKLGIGLLVQIWSWCNSCQASNRNGLQDHKECEVCVLDRPHFVKTQPMSNLFK